jgi:hypothetical protein
MKTFQMRVVRVNRNYEGGADTRTVILKSEELPATGAATPPNGVLEFDFVITDIAGFDPGSVHTVTVT